MAIIKCKMCGGDLKLIENSTVCECEYCGTKQTVPSLDNEKKLTLFSRAGRLLRGCEFDKAAGVFETIVADFPTEAEAYWGLVLCKYGIEYVDDPSAGKKIPTCHRSSFESVMDDPNYEQACENTDAAARKVYREEARRIEELRQAILSVSGREEPYDVFISYKETGENGERTLDSVIAQDIYTELTDKGYRVFFSRISLEDKLGTEYEPYIFAALNSAKVMLVVGTDFENFDAVWVKNEWSRFLKLIAKGEKKTLIPVFKNMDPYDMPKEFAKLAAQDMGKLGAMQDLVRGVEKIVGKKKVEPAPIQPQPLYASGGPNLAALLERGQQALEDSDWEKAKSFFDQVLSMDAENADAFLGLALAEAECRNEDDYINRACEREGEMGAAYLPIAKDVIEKAVRENTIPVYLPEETVRGLFKFDLSFPSNLSDQKWIAEEEKKRFQNDNNLKRAYLYCNGEMKKRLDDFQSRLFSGLDRKVEIAERREDSIRSEKSEENRKYQLYLELAKQKAQELSKRAREKREYDYQAACASVSGASNASDYRACVELFSKDGLKDYKDSRQQIDFCRERISSLEQEVAEKTARETKKILRKAKMQMHMRGTFWLVLISMVSVLFFAAVTCVLYFIFCQSDNPSILFVLVFALAVLFLADRALIKQYRRKYEQLQRPIGYLVVVLILCVLLLLMFAKSMTADDKNVVSAAAAATGSLIVCVIWLISNIRRIKRLDRVDKTVIQ